MKLRPLVAGTALAFASMSAFALPYFPGGVGPFGPTPGTLYEDDNLDFFANNDGSTNTFGLANITVGDDLIAVAEFGKANDVLLPIGPSYIFNTGADEMVAYSAIRVTSIDLSGRIHFGPTAPGAPMVSIYSKSSETNLDLGTYANCNSFANCTAAVTDGNLIASFGLIDADDEWFFDPTPGLPATLPSVVAGLSTATKVGVANFALSVIPGSTSIVFNPFHIGCTSLFSGIFTCAGDGMTQLAGSSDILGGGGLGGPAGATGAFATSDTDVLVNIPEPGSLALIGMGLLGLGATRRNKRV